MVPVFHYGGGAYFVTVNIFTNFEDRLAKLACADVSDLIRFDDFIFDLRTLLLNVLL